MRDYGKVHSSFWTSDTIAALTDDGRMLALYLMTCSHQTIAGVCRLTDGYVSDDLRWGSERVRQGFRDLSKNGFATRCEATFWVVIHNHLQWNPPENPNQRKAIAKIVSTISEKCCWINAFRGVLEGGAWQPFRNGSETVSESGTGAVTGTGTGTGGSGGLTVPPATLPLLPDLPTVPAEIVPVADAPAPGSKTWNAYAAAYAVRYGTDPVRNAKTNAQIKQLVARLGADAPEVAAHYVRSPAAYYAQRGHCLECLLNDAEKLRTEWATGRSMTAIAARQGERLGHHAQLAATLKGELSNER